MAASVGDLKVSLRIVINNNTFKRAKQSVRGVAKETTTLTKEMNKMGKALNGIGFSFRRLILYYGGYKGIKNMVTTISKFEQLKEQLITVERDSVKAEQSWKRLMDFATTTPFTLDKVISGFVRLKAVGLDPTDEQLQSLGDMASAFSMNFDDVAFAVQRAISGVSRPLKKFIPLVKIAGNQISLGFNKDEMITIERDAQKLLETVSDIAKERFAQGMERQLSTIGGQWSLVSDNISKFLFQVGKSGLSEAIVEFAKSLTETVGEGDSLAQTLGKTLGFALRTITKLFKIARDNAWFFVGVLLYMGAAKIRAGLALLTMQIVSLEASVWIAAIQAKTLKGAIASLVAPMVAATTAAANLGRTLLITFGLPLLKIALLTLGVFAFLAVLNDIANFLQGKDSLIGEWFEHNYDQASPPIKMLARLFLGFIAIIEMVARAFDFVTDKLAEFINLLSIAIGETLEFLPKVPSMLSKFLGITDAVGFGGGDGERKGLMGRRNNPIADLAEGLAPSTLSAARDRINAGRRSRNQRIDAMRTYSGARGLTQMAMAGGYGQMSPVTEAMYQQQDLAKARLQGAGMAPAAAPPSVFNITVNGMEKSTSEVGKEIGKQVARDLQGRKQ